MFKFEGPNVEANPKKAPRRLPEILTADEVNYLLPSKPEWRDFVIIQTGVLAGPRVLCALEVSDVDLVGGVLNIRLVKGKKERNVPIGARLAMVPREWIGQRKKGWLFPGPKGQEVNRP